MCSEALIVTIDCVTSVNKGLIQAKSTDMGIRSRKQEVMRTTLRWKLIVNSVNR